MAECEQYCLHSANFFKKEVIFLKLFWTIFWSIFILLNSILLFTIHQLEVRIQLDIMDGIFLIAGAILLSSASVFVSALFAHLIETRIFKR